MVMMLLKFLRAAFACHLLSLTAASIFELPRGVPNSLSKKFQQAQVEDRFSCENGQVISFSRVNDDYCDCIGGHDEPGTSACSEFSHFYCINKGHRGEWIHSSRVDDGVCDCCDGSDEFLSTSCPNSCEAKANEASEAAARRIRVLEDGARRKEEYIQDGIKEIENIHRKLQEITLKLEEKHMKLSEMEISKKVLEKEEQVVKKELRHTSNMKVLRRFPTLYDLGLDELRSLFIDYARRVDKKGKELMCLVTGNEDACFKQAYDETSFDDVHEDYEQEFGDDYDDEYRDEYRDLYGGEYDDFGQPATDDSYWEEDQYENIHHEDSHAQHSEMIDVEDIDLSQGEASLLADNHGDNDLKDDLLATQPHSEQVLSNTVDGIQHEQEDYLHDEMDHFELASLVTARNEIRKQQKAIEKLEREKEELEENVLVPPEMLPLVGKCFQTKQHGYTYEMCPFGEAKQSSESGGSTSLGTMSVKSMSTNDGDDKDESMTFEFSGGAYCYNGPSRSAVVEVLCGVENELLEVDEPRTCEYTMKFLSPAGCDVKHAKGLLLELPMNE